MKLRKSTIVSFKVNLSFQTIPNLAIPSKPTKGIHGKCRQALMSLGTPRHTKPKV